MFGKRNASESAVAKPAAPPREPATAASRAAAPAATAPAPAAAPPPQVAPQPSKPAAKAVTDNRSEDYYQIKSTIFNALIDTIDLAQLAQLDPDSAREEIRDIVNEIISIKAVVMSIAEQEHLLQDICNDVLGYGRWNRCWRATTSPTSWSMAPTGSSSKSRARCSSPISVSATMPS
jgi:pilus assembly protein CpaF